MFEGGQIILLLHSIRYIKCMRADRQAKYAKKFSCIKNAGILFYVSAVRLYNGDIEGQNAHIPPQYTITGKQECM